MEKSSEACAMTVPGLSGAGKEIDGEMEKILDAFDLIKKGIGILLDRMVHDKIEAGRSPAPPSTPFIILPSLWGDLHHLEAGRGRRRPSRRRPPSTDFLLRSCIIGMFYLVWAEVCHRRMLVVMVPTIVSSGHGVPVVPVWSPGSYPDHPKDENDMLGPAISNVNAPVSVSAAVADETAVARIIVRREMVPIM